MEVPIEPRIAEHGYAAGAGDIFAGRKHPANAGLRTQHREDPSGSKPGLNPERMVSAGLFQGHSPISFNGCKNGALALPFQIVLAGHLHPIANRRRQPGEPLPNEYQARRIGIRQCVEDHAVQNAEDRGVGPNSESQDADAHERISGVGAQSMKSISEVASGIHDHILSKRPQQSCSANAPGQSGLTPSAAKSGPGLLTTTIRIVYDWHRTLCVPSGYCYSSPQSGRKLKLRFGR